MTAVSAPERSIQRFEALDLANQIRLGRAKGKRFLKEGKLDPADVLDDPGPLWAGCKVEDFLKQLPRVGPGRVRTIMLRAEVPPAKTLGALTSRQRRVLFESLCKYGPQGRFS